MPLLIPHTLRITTGMSSLTFTTLELPAAKLGEPNPLPPLPRPRPRRRVELADDALEFDGRYIGYGQHSTVLPYLMQDGFDRQRQPRRLPAAVLENETLRAEFALSLGARLWSLVHKPGGRELLYRNDVFQPGSLAARGAWFSGGVEWNFGPIGHHPHTCSPLHTASLRDDRGDPVLRVYEYERIRGTTFQIDFALPAGSPWLLVTVRLINLTDRVPPAYWWSNIAVPEAPDVRVVVPASHAFRFGYHRQLQCLALPEHDGHDMTYATRSDAAYDCYFRVPDNIARPWITAQDAQGQGLMQASTSQLRGRKLFAWGMGPGGRHWQRHLTQDAGPYIEIQAGLARTQMECVPMPPGADWSWTEAYGLLATSPEAVHAKGWAAAAAHVEQCIDQALPVHTLHAIHRQRRTLATQPPEHIVGHGSGWGALERRRCRADGQAEPFAVSTVFEDASMGREQEPWLALLEEGQLPAINPADFPGSYQSSEPWGQRLADALAAGRGCPWLTELHLGIIAAAHDRLDEAETHWRRSLSHESSLLGHRCLARVLSDRAEPAAIEHWHQAVTLAPASAAVAVEACNAMVRLEAWDALERLQAMLPQALQQHGRVQLAEATRLLARGEFDAAESRLDQIEIADYREGETSLTDLWFRIQAHRLAQAEQRDADDPAVLQRVRATLQPPARLDFRMA